MSYNFEINPSHCNVLFFNLPCIPQKRGVELQEDICRISHTSLQKREREQQDNISDRPHKFRVFNPFKEIEKLPFSEDAIFCIDQDRLGSAEMGGEDEDILGTYGVGPCIVIIGMGVAENGKRVNTLYHWSGPEPDEDLNESAVEAIKCINHEMCKEYSVLDNTIRYYLIGSDKGSQNNLKALMEAGNIPRKNVRRLLKEIEGGWDIIIAEETIYYGASLLHPE